MIGDTGSCLDLNSNFQDRLLFHDFVSAGANDQLSTSNKFEDIVGSKAYVILTFNIDEADTPCVQRIQFEVKDESADQTYSQTFRLEVISSGIFS